MPISNPAVNAASPGSVALKVPRHLGVIMDGNGRWARARGKPRTEGHVAGVKALRRLVDLCLRYDVKHLSVFSFSSENWSRPEDEVSFIFGLLRRFVASDLETLYRNNVRVKVIGARDSLEESLRRLIIEAEVKTSGNTGLELIVAFNYGGKREIAEAARRLAAQVADGHMRPEEVTEEAISAQLYTAGVPDPDVIVRTSGEQRFSNFLIWQSAYAELIFVDEYWPDFDESTFLHVLEEYGARERRFGGVEARRL